MTAQGQPRARFRRAIERKPLLGKEACAREMGLWAGPSRSISCASWPRSIPQDWMARPGAGSLLAHEKPLRLGELDLAVTALRAIPSSRARDALGSLL